MPRGALLREAKELSVENLSGMSFARYRAAINQHNPEIKGALTGRNAGMGSGRELVVRRTKLKRNATTE
ncbi:hypothetical protein CE91St30_23660 [Raoultibacter timonensis]|uniref:Uncharacterized protein n=1 Tax=Raoultibacter timonensis TaxID=1907662 RepID=A0ABN6MKE3_9ACTN|nr:hypothetical protein CE91St30_23660 [Raoultibacter timonensis]BDF51637.1 hypothetical protein CE91St31_23670 [Raoultibacter timonensis]